MTGHALTEVARFTERTVRFEDGLPVREPIAPYHRYYCACGAVGGKTATETASRSGHARHVEEVSGR